MEYYSTNTVEENYIGNKENTEYYSTNTKQGVLYYSTNTVEEKYSGNKENTKYYSTNTVGENYSGKEKNKVL